MNNKPVPSSRLIAQPPDNVAPSTLKSWKVTVLRLSPAETVEFLCNCMDKQTLGLGVVVGNDIAFWATALRFASPG